MAGKGYIWDKVLSKPSPVLTTPMFDDDESEAAALSEFFSVTLPDDTTVRYRQDLAGKFGSQFLCTDWAFARITGTVVDGEPFGVKVPEGTTDYTAATMETELNGMGLIACTEDDDSDRIALIWAIPNKKTGEADAGARISHIQVLHAGRWESKLSAAQWVLCHDEDLFSTFVPDDGSGKPLVKAIKGKRYFKRKGKEGKSK